MTDAEWITGMHGQRYLDLSLDQAGTVQKMLTNGDLHHIDGPYILALADLAETGETTFCGCKIDRIEDDWWVTLGEVRRAHDPREALDVARNLAARVDAERAA